MHSEIDNILCMTNVDPRFYQLVGPFLSNRDIVKELGTHIWDDLGKVWYIALKNQKITLGICAYIEKKTVTIFCSDYILPQYRGRGIYRALFEERLKYAPGKRIRAITTAQSLSLYLDYHFKIVREFNRYTTVERQMWRNEAHLL